MSNWPIKTLPASYRPIVQSYAAIEARYKTLPPTWYDVTRLKPRERDLFELYCELSLKASTITSDANQSWSSGESDNIFLDYEYFNKLVKDNFSDEDLKLINSLFMTVPQRLILDPRAFFGKEKQPNLLCYLAEQQKNSSWLPPASLNPDHLTWVAWEELLALHENFGYNRAHDDTEHLAPIIAWDHHAKDKIFHLMLEMIDPAQVHDVWTQQMGRELDDLPDLRQKLRKV